MVLVSVITPAFNAADFIEDAIMSVAQSKSRDYEHIVVDDGSTDPTVMVIERTLRKMDQESSSRVRFFSKANSGEADTDNFALSKSRGEFLIVLNADDIIGPELIGKSIQEMTNNPEVVVTYPDWLMIEEGGKVIDRITTQNYSIEKLIGWFDCLPGPGACIRRSALGEGLFRDPRFPLISDYECWQRLSQVGPFLRIPEFHGFWRLHGENLSLTSRGHGWAKQAIQVAREFRESEMVVRDGKLKRLASLGLSRAYLLAAIQGVWDRSVPMMTYFAQSLKLGILNGRLFLRKDVLVVLKILQASLSQGIRIVSRGKP
jgi:GT2 family glycosyltransferase